ncbi:MAG TPA: hypothetical protein VGE26_10590 [Sphingobacteriaceae bacterium]
MVISSSKRIALLVMVAGSLIGAFAFRPADDLKMLAAQAREKLSAIYDPEAGKMKLKKIEIRVTDDGFFRYRKFLSTGKQEYFSFSLLRLSDIRYIGNTSGGTLIIETVSDDVIVQTYNDRAGNVDSMSTDIKIPVRMAEPEDLNLIHNNLQAIKARLQRPD